MKILAGAAEYGRYVRQARVKMIADTIRIFVRALPEARRFYQGTLGMPLVADESSSGYLIFQPGGISLLIERVDPSDTEAQPLVGRFVGLSLRVDDVDSAFRELGGQGVKFDGRPEEQPWGGTLAHFYDQDRNVLTLVGGAA